MKPLACDGHEIHRLSCYQNSMEADLNDVTQARSLMEDWRYVDSLASNSRCVPSHCSLCDIPRAHSSLPDDGSPDPEGRVRCFVFDFGPAYNTAGGEHNEISYTDALPARWPDHQ